MIVYYILSLIILFCYYYSPNNNIQHNKRLMRRNNCGKLIFKKSVFVTSFACVSTLVVMGFRDFSVGMDTSRYVLIFENHLYGSGNEVMTSRADWLYTYFNNYLSDIMSARGYLLLVSCIFIFTIYKFANKECNNVVLFLFFYITIGTFSMNMTGIRQSLAGCVLILAYFFARNNNFAGYLLSSISAFLTHTSAIIAVVIYPVLRIYNVIDRKGAVIISLIPLFGFYASSFVKSIVIFLDLHKYLPYLLQPGINLKCFVFYYVLYLFLTILYFRENKTLTTELAIHLKLGIIVPFCYSVAPNVFLFDRLAIYFLPFLLAYYASALSLLKNNDTRRISTALCIVFSFVWFVGSTINGSYGIDNYKFCF